MTNPFAREIVAALDEVPELPCVPWHETGAGEWPAWYAVTDLAAASIGAAASEIAGLRRPPSSAPQAVSVDRRLASLWFDWSLRTKGWALPAAWDALAGDYETADGWIKLHTNAPHHKQAALAVLGGAEDRETLAAVVAGWDKNTLEAAVVDAGGCAAAMHSTAEWQKHPQGLALANAPLIDWTRTAETDARSAAADTSAQVSPLHGIRVLDLTRVLAGPVASRFLARFGADVLRIDPPTWDEPGVIPEVTLGKRCAGLDLHTAEDRALFETLLQNADVLLHGYRPGALDNLGYSQVERHKLNPQLVDVSLCAYGLRGPWAGRRGFDSLVQMSCGIAHYGMQRAEAAKPTPLPVQALDHATGYLLAAATLRALRARQSTGTLYSARLSLARTARLLLTSARTEQGERFSPEASADQDPWQEQTAWGPAHRLKFPVGIDVHQGWPHPANGLRTSSPQWQTATNSSTG